jgi:hypothetical protein
VCVFVCCLCCWLLISSTVTFYVEVVQARSARSNVSSERPIQCRRLRRAYKRYEPCSFLRVSFSDYIASVTMTHMLSRTQCFFGLFPPFTTNCVTPPTMFWKASQTNKCPMMNTHLPHVQQLFLLLLGDQTFVRAVCKMFCGFCVVAVRFVCFVLIARSPTFQQTSYALHAPPKKGEASSLILRHK